LFKGENHTQDLAYIQLIMYPKGCFYINFSILSLISD